MGCGLVSMANSGMPQKSEQDPGQGTKLNGSRLCRKTDTALHGGGVGSQTPSWQVEKTWTGIVLYTTHVLVHRGAFPGQERRASLEQPLGPARAGRRAQGHPADLRSEAMPLG